MTGANSLTIGGICVRIGASGIGSDGDCVSKVAYGVRIDATV